MQQQQHSACRPADISMPSGETSRGMCAQEDARSRLHAKKSSTRFQAAFFSLMEEADADSRSPECL